MIPKRIKIENFLSFGSPAVELDFEGESLWVVAGPNGVGKSAVFDAMTYALYGEHRGGVHGVAKLIHHGANALRVEFEFESDGTDYLIARSYARSPTRRVFRRAGGEWEPVQLPGAGDTVKAWSERTLGLTFKAFTASVLLLQGQAEAVVTAAPAARLSLLKSIIAAERYESLSSRVHQAERGCEVKLDDLRVRRGSLDEVTEGQLGAARDHLAEAEKAREQADAEVVAAGSRVPLARQWADLEGQHASLQRDLDAADRRAADAGRIREQAARLSELTGVVPRLRGVVAARDSIASAREEMGKLKPRIVSATAARDARAEAAREESAKADLSGRAADEYAREAKRLVEEVKHETKLLGLAEEAVALTSQLREFPTDLDARFTTARDAERTSTKLVAECDKAKAVAGSQLKRAEEQQREFDQVEVGVPCSRCRQPVDEGHARIEREQLAEEVHTLELRVREARLALESAVTANGAAEKEATSLERLARQRAEVKSKLDAKQETLAGFDRDAEPDALRRRIAGKKDEAAAHERRQAEEKRNQADVTEVARCLAEEQRGFENELSGLSEKACRAEQLLNTSEGKLQTLLGQLAEPWGGLAATVTTGEVDQLEVEHARLAGAGVEEAAKQLDQDAGRREVWRRQLDEVSQSAEQIPPEARVGVPDAERALGQARTVATRAGQARDAAKEDLGGLDRCREERLALAKELRQAERKHILHEKLDHLLGGAGLLRDLVRDAEREIVRLAHDTVQHLSDGDLTIELAGEAEGDKALSLRVRRGDGGEPIDAAFLSGSQKFRVAVAVALAVGRFAAGKSRPLDCVIIDEGFGGLDRDGLRAAAEELNRLKGQLRRILLVSHQEEFAANFPAGYRLGRGENGTTAERFRA